MDETTYARAVELVADDAEAVAHVRNTVDPDHLDDGDSELTEAYRTVLRTTD